MFQSSQGLAVLEVRGVRLSSVTSSQVYPSCKCNRTAFIFFFSKW
jgi:hypothetical protein